MLAVLAIWAVLVGQHYFSSGQAAHILASVIQASFLVFAQALSVIIAVAAYRLSPLHPLAHFPGSWVDKVTSLRVAYLALTGHRAKHVTSLHDRYGDVVRIGPNRVSINSSDAIYPIYASPQAFDRAASYRPGLIHDGSLLFSRKRVEHGHRKRIWAGALTSHAIQHWDGALKDRVDQLIDCIARRQDLRGVVDLGVCIEHWGFDFIYDVIFGINCNTPEFMRNGDPQNICRSAKNSIVLFEVLGEIPTLFDIASVLPVTEEYREVERHFQKHINERMQINSHSDWDFCSFFMAQREDAQYPPLSKPDLNADALVAFEAGGDTLAGFLSIIIFYILKHQPVYEKLRAELEQVFPLGEIAQDRYGSLTEIPYLVAVINEGLRLRANFAGFQRVVPQGGTVLAGQFVPGGTVVGVPAHLQHIHPDNFWPTPLEFRPERWFKDGLGPGTITRQTAFMAFQFGPFGCVGKTFAYRQLTVVLSRLLLAYDLKFAPDFDSKAFVEGWLNIRTTIFNYPLQVQASRRQW